MATLYVEYKDSGKKDEHGKTILAKHEKDLLMLRQSKRSYSVLLITGINSPAEAYKPIGITTFRSSFNCTNSNY